MDAPQARMRSRLFGAEADDLDVSPSERLPRVFGLLFETGYAEGTLSLVALGDGTVALYFPTGGAVIGAPDDAPVRAFARALLEAVEGELEHFEPSASEEPPAPGRVRAFALTRGGTRALEGTEHELEEGVGTPSAVFYAAHAVITQIRLATQRAERAS